MMVPYDGPLALSCVLEEPRRPLPMRHCLFGPPTSSSRHHYTFLGSRHDVLAVVLGLPLVRDATRWARSILIDAGGVEGACTNA